MISFGEEICGDLQAGLQREWLETDGLGGFASSTISGANTRRYHGLLVAATQPPVGRRVLLSRLEERIRCGAETSELSTNLYVGAVHPQGYRLLREFRLDPWPVMVYQHPSWTLEKEVFMPHGGGGRGQAATVLRYTVRACATPLWLRLRPLLACRDYHHLARSGADFRPNFQRAADRFTLQPWDPGSRVTVIHPGGEFWPDGLWYYNFSYPREAERGLDSVEDLYSPGELAWLVNAGESVYVVATTDPELNIDPERWAQQERRRREKVAARAPSGDEVGRQLSLAADQFLVRRTVQRRPLLSLIAGYPWFTDWGRDAMIAAGALLGLPGWAEPLGKVLRAWAAYLRDGLLPNTFDDSGQGAAYNTVDAALWFVHAVHGLARPGGDLETAAVLYDPVREILRAYQEGTDFGIAMDADGLVRAGAPGLQLTWMDAKCGDQVFTPREGKPVEINALWYNAVRAGQFLAERLDSAERAREYAGLAERIKLSFREKFWDAAHGWCYDCLTERGPDPSLRPNQLIALSLPYAVLTREQALSLFQAVTEHLLTPYGLRTLAPGAPGYRGRYEGDQYARDSAYHQGTVWPWLLGPYLDGYFWLYGVGSDTRRHARELLAPLVAHLAEAGLGSISEVFDGDAPQYPRGCIAQAWSVATVLRVWLLYGLAEGG
jgi:predicted glycogen debranching enzyme